MHINAYKHSISTHNIDMKKNNLTSNLSLGHSIPEHLFKTVFNQQFQFMAILNPDGLVVEVNKLALIEQGSKREEYVGKFFWCSPEFRSLPEWEVIWKQRLVDASTQNKTIFSKDVFQVADGSLHYSDSSVTAIYPPDSPELYGYIVQAIDTTERHSIEEQLHDNQARLNFVLENSQIGSWDLDLTTLTSRRSLKHDQIFGYEELLPEWTYNMFIGHVHPEDKEKVDYKFQYAINNKTDWNFECRIVRNNGEVRWIIASGGTLEATGKSDIMCGIVQDITSLKELELKESLRHDELKSLLKSLPDTYFRMMPDGTILDCSTQNKEILYQEPESFIGQRMQDVLPDKVGELFQSKIKDVNKTKSPLNFEYELVINNTLTQFDARINSIPINGQIICVVRDISAQVYLKNVLEESQSAAKLGSWVQTFDNEVLFWSKEAYNIFEFDHNATITMSIFSDRIHPDDREEVFSCFISSVKNKTLYQIEHRILFDDGRIKYVLEIAEHMYDADNHHIQSVGTVQDITDQKSKEEKLRLSHRVFNDTHEGIIITNKEQIIVNVNPAFSNISGYSYDEIIGQHTKILNSGKQSRQFYQQMWKSIEEHGFWQGEIWNKTKHGKLYAELLNISSLTNDLDEITHYVGIFSDITDRKKQLEKLNLMAHYDLLTKLPNRALFIDRFQQSIAHSSRTGHQLAICFLDLDNFKPINDNYGHEVGDKLLIEIAKRISHCIREEDTVSRQGGDEFAILLNDINSTSQYEITMQRIHQKLSVPYIVNGIELNVTASSGVTLYPSDTGDIDTLLRHADHAMYQSKLTGKNRYQLYNPDSDQRIIKQNILVDEIEQALNDQDLVLYFQPKVNMTTGKIIGVEALIRWNHKVKGLIPPVDFLPFIENTELDIKIGKWVIQTSLNQLHEWLQQGIKFEISINISSNHLLSPSFIESLENFLSHYPPHYSQYLQLEILESSAFVDIQAITDIIEKCQDSLGVTFSLDDFGTGYSSLTHLRRLPVNTIKIDQSFVRDILDDPSDFSIIEGVIALTKSFNRKVIAEGVETTNHGLMLLLMGCELAQGYEVAKPMPIAIFNKWLNNYIPNDKWAKYAVNSFSKSDISLEVLKLLSKHIFESINKNISSSTHSPLIWPDCENQASHLYNWLRRKKQEQLFDSNFIVKVEKLIDKFQSRIRSIEHCYNKGDIENTLSGLADLENIFNEIKKLDISQPII